jgi:hypothetical protein
VANFAGYLQLRRAIFEHLRDGRLSKFQALGYIYIATQADTRTGIWRGSAGAFAGEFCCSERSARHLIESLSDRGYLKRFPTPGRHFCYPILVNKYLVTDGEHAGERLNASASKSWQQPVYEKNGDFGEHRGEHKGGQSAPQRRRENKEGKSKPSAAKPAAPADPRYQLFIDFALLSFERKHTQKPTWGQRDFRNLRALLESYPSLPLAEIERRWENYASSTDDFFSKSGDSLCFFCSRFDTFIGGPLLVTTRTGGIYSGGQNGTGFVSKHSADQDRVVAAAGRSLS